MNSLIRLFVTALGGTRPGDSYGSEPSKRHTMSYEPEIIPDMEHIDQRPSPIKNKKDKVSIIPQPQHSNIRIPLD